MNISGVKDAYEIQWAKTPKEVVQAQALRYEVFAQELKATLPSFSNGLDIDPYDEFCDHLLIRHLPSEQVVGTYRVLNPESAKRCGKLYSESEFQLDALNPIRSELVEVGRSCVHPDFRHGGVILALWRGLGQYMKANHYRWMLGCASVSLGDGGHLAASLNRSFKANPKLDPGLHVEPIHPLQLDGLQNDLDVQPPPLLKGYIRLGAKICGDPAHDKQFNTADFLTLLDCNAMRMSYIKHFMT
jgi:putative hemolysin